MVKGIRIYVEGDSRRSSKYSNITFRQGFHTFLKELIDKAREKRIKFDVIPSGIRDETYKDFCRGLKSHADSFVILLVDSENAVAAGNTAKRFLQETTTWDLKDTRDEQCHLMVQIMESWFLADTDALKAYYGKGFNVAAIQKNPKVEEVLKADILGALSKATKNSSKGEYHKTRHGTELLTRIDPKKVRQVAPHCEKLFRTISEVIE